MRVFQTGGTGFIGGHVADALREHGHEVVALARQGSDTSHLARIGAVVVEGDITDAAAVEAGMQGTDAVVHCAAVVGPVGSWQHFETVGVGGTERVVKAAERTGTRRVIHLGSTAVYGTDPRGRTFSESTPFEYKPEGWNHYVREKVLSERVLWEAHGFERIVATSIRPAIVLGPGDRHFLPRIRAAATSRFGGLVGAGTNYLAFAVVEEVAEAVVRALENDETAGKSYNLAGTRRVTQREMYNMVTDALGLPRVQRQRSFGRAMRSAGMLELAWKLAMRPGEPPVTRFGVALIGQQYQVDSSKAAADLGWKGVSDFEDAIQRAVEWERVQGSHVAG